MLILVSRMFNVRHQKTNGHVYPEANIPSFKEARNWFAKKHAIVSL